MLAKVIPNRASKHGRVQNFKARVAYPIRNATAVEMANLAGTWADAAFQMRTTAGLAPFLHNPSYHFILTWADEEHPEDEQVFDAGHRAIAELGGSEHQYVMAIHKNRPNIHLHIVCNRVHPISGLTLSTSNDFARLELACRKIETLNGWPQDRGRFDCTIVNDIVTLTPKPASHWQQKTCGRQLGLRPDGRAVRMQEHRTGLPPMRDFISAAVIVKLRTALDASTSWKEVHQIMARESLQIQPHRSGARISRSEGTFFIPAGQFGTRYTLNSLEARLGQFAGPDLVAEVTNPIIAKPPETASSATNPSPFMALIQSVTEVINDIKRWRCERADLRKKLRAAQVEEERQVRDLLRGCKTPAAQALRRVMTAKHREQAVEFRSMHPPPHAIPFDATSHIARLAPKELDRRRYRHVHRATEMIQGPEHDPASIDHTACRQAWSLAEPKDTACIPKPIASIIHRHPDDIRVDRRGNLLFARRNAAGSIVGFEVRRGQDLYADVHQPSGCGDGLCLLGPRSSKSYVVVPDVMAALIRASAGKDEPDLIIVAGEIMTPRSEHQLRDLKTGRIYGLEPGPVLSNRATTRDAPNAFGDDLGIDGIAVEPHNHVVTPAEHEIDDDRSPSKGPTPFF